MNVTALPDDHPARAAAMPAPEPINIRRVTIGDLMAALAAGWSDLRYCRTDALLMAIIYPIAGIVFASVFVIQGLLPFVFPLFTGFALVGPLTTLWFAALSRQRERGDEGIAAVFAPPHLEAIERLSGIAILIFFSWNVSAAIIYFFTLGNSDEDASSGFFYRVFHTQAGLEMMVVGCAVGAVFAVITLAVSFISFPLVIDRPVTAVQAITVSCHALLRNPVFVFAWGAVVVVGLIAGALPCLIGLVIVLPMLGHGTWHVYRKMVT